MVEVAGEEHERAKSRFRLWSLFCICVAILLFSAAASKAWNAPVIMAQNGLLSNKGLLLATIGIELASAVLIFALRDHIAWWIVVSLFTLFFVAACYSIISGAECNCFGFDLLGAWFTLPIDVCLVVIAFVLRSKAYAPKVFGWRAQSVIAIAGASALVGVAIAEFRNLPNRNPEKLEYLVADDMIGRPWPITKEYHPDLEQLQSGKWLVLILRPDCDHCRELVERHFEDPTWHRPGERTAIFLAGSDEWSFRFDHVSMEPGPSKIEWKAGEPFVASPFVVKLSDGIIRLNGESVGPE